MKINFVKIKKAVSLFMAMGLITSVMPNKVFANYQNPVTTITIQNDGTASGGSYNIRLNWDRPLYSSKSDGAIVNGDELDPTYSYKIEWRNGSSREAYGKLFEAIPPTNEEGLTKGLTKTLDGGSIYSFKITPSHNNTYQELIDGVLQTPYEAPAPLDTTVTPGEALYLTDIKIKSESEGGKLKVTWKNPTYMGQNVFTGYRLYYELGGATANFTNGSDYLDMSLSGGGVTSNSDGTISYLFDVPNMEIGKLYALKIEPLYGAEPVKASGISRVVVGGISYSLAYSNNEYRTDDAYVKAGLFLKEEGLENVRLYWDSLSSITSVSKVEVWSYPNGNLNNPTLLGVISGSDASNINYWLTEKPDRLTGYKIVVTHADGTMESDIVYYDPSHKDFDPYKPIIRQAIPSATPDFDLYWQAFLRNPYNDDEKNAINSKYGKYVDNNVSYKIWVTDDLNNLTDLNFQPFYILNRKADTFGQSDFEIGFGESTLVYNTIISSYYSFQDGIETLNPIKDNKIYYIKIEAKREPSGDVSEPEFYSIFVPPTSEIITNPVTLGNPPLRILKNADGSEAITENTIGIEWDKNWYEVFNTEEQSWNAVVGVDDDGKIVFGDAAQNLEDSSKIFNLYELRSLGSVDEAKAHLYDKLISIGAVDSTGKPYTSQGDLAVDLPLRAMTIKNADYEVFTATLNHVEANGGYEVYLDSITNLSDQWVKVPGNSSNPQNYIVNSQQAPTTGPLTSNTSYVVYFRSYVIGENGEKIYSYYPSYILANTTKAGTDIIVTPPTQQIQTTEPITDTSITVKWPYSSNFTYELKYTDKVTEYPSGGITVSDSEILKNGTKKIDADGVEYIYYTVPNLFPNTNYYFWLKATSGGISSGWSPAVNERTKDLETPPVPAGLGLIGKNNLEVINAANDKNFVQSDKNYLIVEWLRVNNDSIEAVNGIIPTTGGEFLSHPNLISTYAAKFNNLQGNKKYYVRIKSRVSITKEERIKKYSYIISLADNAQFVDAIEFEVPTYGYIDNNLDVLVRESNWSTYKSFTTGKDDDEFDGDFDPELYPLPENNYEVIFDEDTDTLTYKFLDGNENSNGTPNHGVDNRFISELIKDNIYDFAVDVTLNDGKKVKNREVVIPYSIINSMGDYKTSLTIKADNMFTKFDLSMIEAIAKVNNVSDFGKGSKVVFKYKEIIGDPTMISYGESYVSTPQQMTATLITPSRQINIKNFPKPVNVSMGVSNRYLSFDNTLKAFYTDDNSEDWIGIGSKYSLTDNKFNFDTMKVGIYTVIGKESPRTTSDSETNSASLVVSNYINFTDMPYFTSTEKVTANQFNNVISAIAKGEDSVTINKTLSQEDFNQLGRGKLLVSGSYVTREKGIASLVRLYELKTKSSLDRGYDLEESGFDDYSEVSSEYKVAMEKAIDLGFLDLDEKINAKGDMNFGEFMYMLEFIVTSY